MHALNKIYRTIWSEALNAWVAVLVKTKGKRASSSLLRVLNIGGVDATTDDLQRHQHRLTRLDELLDALTQGGPMRLIDVEMPSRVEQRLLAHLAVGAHGAHKPVGEISLTGARAAGVGLRFGKSRNPGRGCQRLANVLL